MLKRNILKVILIFALSILILLFYNAAIQKKQKITICTNQSHWISGCTNEELNSKVVEKINSKLKIKINPVVLKNDNYKKELDSLLYSYNSPDVSLIPDAMPWSAIYAKSKIIIPLDDLIKKQLLISNEYYKHLQPNYPIPVSVSQIYDKNYNDLKKFREDIIYKIITDEITIEKGYEDYKNYWQSINGDEILKEMNAAL